MKITNKLPQKNVNLSDASPIGNFAKSIVGCLVLLAALYFSMVWGVNLAVPHVSPEVETWLADVILTQYDGGERTARERTLQNMLDSLAASGPGLPYKVTVHVEESEDVNAFALPGGNIVMLTGLLDEVESENELAFILGHELGHIVHRDHLSGLGRVMAMTVLNLGFQYVAGVDLVPDVLTLFDRSVSRKQEAAADRFGLDRLHAQYGRIDGSLAFFKRQREKWALPAWAAYFSTHPKDEDRINALEEYARAKGYAAGP